MIKNILKIGAGSSAGALVFFVITKVFDKIFTSELQTISWILGSVTFLLLVATAAVISYLVTIHYNKKHGCPEDCGKNLEKTNGIVDSLRELKNQEIIDKISTCIIDDDTLEELEKRAGHGSSIYVMTSNFKLETEKYEQAIVDNLKEGVEYRYIIPRTHNKDEFDEMLHIIFKALKTKLSLSGETKKDAQTIMSSQFKVVSVDDNFVFVTTVLYHFSADDNEVIVKLPYTSNTDTQVSEKYVYKIPHYPTSSWTKLLEKIRGIYTSILNPQPDTTPIGAVLSVPDILGFTASTTQPRHHLAKKK
jgi:hypothetical protein